LKWLLRKITNGLTSVSQYLVTYGVFGLFAISLLDSAMIPMPGGPDAVLILLSAARPSWMFVYAATATLGSVIGCLILYFISAKAGRRALARFSASKHARVKDLIDRYDVLAVLVASLLPPPFPFKLFVVSAGVFRLNVWRFTIAITAGRAFRYLLEGYFAARYGDNARELLSRYYPAIGVCLAVLIILIYLVRGILKNRSNKSRGFQLADAVEEETIREI
jgi:membrane protein YqaA with SNARE-associated domain